MDERSHKGILKISWDKNRNNCTKTRNVSKTVLRGKFIGENIYFDKEEIINLSQTLPKDLREGICLNSSYRLTVPLTQGQKKH